MRVEVAIGLEDGDLACGPHEPLSNRGAKLLRDAGERPTRLHNNCSGKHAAMLACAHTAGWPMFGYERSDHDVQKCCLSSVAHSANASSPIDTPFTLIRSVADTRCGEV